MRTYIGLDMSTFNVNMKVKCHLRDFFLLPSLDFVQLVATCLLCIALLYGSLQQRSATQKQISATIIVHSFLLRFVALLNRSSAATQRHAQRMCRRTFTAIINTEY